jgi:hypothetical protein
MRIPAVLVLALAFAGPAAAQIPITAIGLGYPVAPVDARAAALGSTGIGLLGGTFSLRNPADLSEHRRPGFGMALVAEDADVETESIPLDTGRQRFTVIRAIVPFAGWTVSVGFGSELDQDWSAQLADTLALDPGLVPFEELREHDGGISAVDLSLARRLGPFSVGVSGQRLLGSVRQSFVRTFDAPLEGAPPLAGAGGSQRISYRAWRFKAGASLNLADRIMLSGVVGFAGNLTAEPRDSTVAARLYDLPTTVELGASIRLVDSVLVSAGGGWAEWSSVDGLDEEKAHDTKWGGAGLEYRSLGILGFRMPLRFGIRRTELPFSLGESVLDETAYAAGAGFIFRQGQAAVDLAFEFGRRGDFESDGLEESFRRLTISFTLRQ